MANEEGLVLQRITGVNSGAAAAPRTPRGWHNLRRLAPGNAAYWVSVVGGAFLLNLLLMILVSGD